MGYTHYWKYDPEAIADTEELRARFGKAAKVIKKFVDFAQISGVAEVRGGRGVGDPIVNESEIWLNGDETRNEDHETFSIHWCRTDRDGGTGNFCKTGRKPYDIVVCFSLLAFSDSFPIDVFSFSSDGRLDGDDWSRALRYYEEITGRKPRGRGTR